MNIQTQAEFSRSRRELISALRKLRRGDFTVRMPEEGTDADIELATLFNEVVALIEEMGGFPAEGFGFDLNGFAGAPGPRFGENGICNKPQSNPVTYPFTSWAGDVTFTEPRVGERVIDFNTEGFAHIGLLPELIEDVLRDGVTHEELTPLFKSAEGYIRMWEKAEARGADIRENSAN